MIEPAVAANHSVRHVRYDVLGVRVDLRSDDPVVIDTVDASYGTFRAGSAPGGATSTVPVEVRVGHSAGRWRVEAPGRDARDVPTPEIAAIDALDALVDSIQRGLHASGSITVHASTIQVGVGVLLIAAPSGSGKTTLALGLADRGHRVLSDELAVLGHDATVRAYPRALHVRPDTLRLIPRLAFLADRPRLVLGGGSEWALTPSELHARFGIEGADSRPAAGPLAAVLIVDGIPGLGVPSVTPLSPALAAMELARGSWAASADFVGCLARLAAATSRVPCGRLVNGPLRPTLDVIESWLAMAHEERRVEAGVTS